MGRRAWPRVGAADAGALPQLGYAAVAAADRQGSDALMSEQAERSRRVRRSAIALGLVAFAFYITFIILTVTGFRT